MLEIAIEAYQTARTENDYERAHALAERLSSSEKRIYCDRLGWDQKDYKYWIEYGSQEYFETYDDSWGDYEIGDFA